MSDLGPLTNPSIFRRVLVFWALPFSGNFTFGFAYRVSTRRALKIALRKGDAPFHRR